MKLATIDYRPCYYPCIPAGYHSHWPLPWYLLGLSNAPDMFDISGTMWMVTLAFVYGLKSHKYHIPDY
jgi:hypothetical protein